MQLGTIFNCPIAVLALVAPSAVLAQTSPGSLERTIPELEDEAPKEQTRVATPSAAQSQGRVSGSFILGAVNIDGSTTFDSTVLGPVFDPYLASEVGQAELEKIAVGVTQHYRREGFLLSYAVVPKQSVQSGIVRIQVVEGFIEKLRIVADKRSAAAVLRVVERLTAERPLRTSTLERTLGIVRDMPGVVLKDARISRSPADPARQQLTIYLNANRVRAVAYTDNRGTIGGARARAYSSVNLSSVAIAADQLQFDLFSIPSDHFRFFYGQAKASLPLTPDGLRLSATVAGGDQGLFLAGDDRHGDSRQLTADMSYPFSKSRTLSLIARASLSDWKSHDRSAGSLVQHDRLQVARAGLEFLRASPARIDGRIFVSRGLGTGGSTEAGDPLASRPGAGGKFTKLNAQVQIVAPMSKRVFFRLDTAAQLSSASLLASEEFALGGSRIGRAFDFNEATGDHGFGGMIELSYRFANSAHLPKSLEVFAFTDGGAAFRKRPSPGFPDHRWIASTGIGTRLSAFGTVFSGEIGVPVAHSHSQRAVRVFVSAAKEF